MIICQMTKTRAEVLHWLLIPVAVMVYTATAGYQGRLEEPILIVFTVFVTAAHVHYGVCVVNIHFYNLGCKFCLLIRAQICFWPSPTVSSGYSSHTHHNLRSHGHPMSIILSSLKQVLQPLAHSATRNTPSGMGMVKPYCSMLLIAPEGSVSQFCRSSNCLAHVSPEFGDRYDVAAQDGQALTPLSPSGFSGCTRAGL